MNGREVSRRVSWLAAACRTSAIPSLNFAAVFHAARHHKPADVRRRAVGQDSVLFGLRRMLQQIDLQIADHLIALDRSLQHDFPSTC